MTSSSSPPADDEAYWRRPAGPAGPTGPTGPPGDGRPDGDRPRPPAPPPYAGPPRSAPPPFGWRPPVVVQPPAPRQLPEQDHATLDQQEHTARTITSGVGLIGGAVMLLLLLVLCGRWLF